mgnify:CR=1 FL=1
MIVGQHVIVGVLAVFAATESRVFHDPIVSLFGPPCQALAPQGGKARRPYSNWSRYSGQYAAIAAPVM